MVNVTEIEQKLLQQIKNNHQKSISDDNLCIKLIDKYEECKTKNKITYTDFLHISEKAYSVISVHIF